MSTRILFPIPVRYGHTYQSGISDDTILESKENINSIALGRKESAHIILKILSKLEIPSIRDLKDWLKISKAHAFSLLQLCAPVSELRL